MAAFPVNGHEPLFPLENIINILPPPLRRLSITKINYFLFVFSFGGGCDILRTFGAWKMKIKGFYILTRRSIARMIAVMATAFVVLCSAVTTKDEPLVNRIRSTSIALYALDGEIDGRSTRTVVPAVHYIEFKSVYLEAKRYNKEHENPEKTARRDASPHHAARRWGESSGRTVAARRDASPHHAAVTKADLRAAVKTIIRGEDVFASKPGPRITPAKQRQIEAAEKWRATHAGCSLYNACLRSFVPAKGGYKSAKVMYRILVRNDDKS